METLKELRFDINKQKIRQEKLVISLSLKKTEIKLLCELPFRLKPIKISTYIIHVHVCLLYVGHLTLGFFDSCEAKGIKKQYNLAWVLHNAHVYGVYVCNIL